MWLIDNAKMTESDKREKGGVFESVELMDTEVRCYFLKVAVYILDTLDYRLAAK